MIGIRNKRFRITKKQLWRYLITGGILKVNSLKKRINITTIFFTNSCFMAEVCRETGINCCSWKDFVSLEGLFQLTRSSSTINVGNTEHKSRRATHTIPSMLFFSHCTLNLVISHPLSLVNRTFFIKNKIIMQICIKQERSNIHSLDERDSAYCNGLLQWFTSTLQSTLRQMIVDPYHHHDRPVLQDLPSHHEIPRSIAL